MRHKTLDMEAVIARAPIALGFEGLLVPIFEAISNSMYGIHEKFGKDFRDSGAISLSIDTDNARFFIQDNGIGLNNSNLNHFRTPFTANKLKPNGKGFGRIIGYKVFETILYSSKFTDEENHVKKIKFRYNPVSTTDNLIEGDSEAKNFEHDFETGVSVCYKIPREGYLSVFSEDSDIEPEDYVTAVINHFLSDFIKEKTPKKFLLNIDGVTFDLNEYFSDNIENVSTYTEVINFAGGDSSKFSFNVIRISATQTDKHLVYILADDRTLDRETQIDGLKEGRFRNPENPKLKEYYYIVTASSPKFVADDARSEVKTLQGLTVSVEGKDRSVPIKKHIANLARQYVLENEKQYEKDQRAKIKTNVSRIIGLDPILRTGLGKQTVDEFVANRGLLETPEQLAQDLFVARKRYKFDFSKVDKLTNKEEIERIVKEEIGTEQKEALAVYVAYRGNVIKLLQKMLENSGEGVASEAQVHKLIYPRYKDDLQVDFSEHNLWLLDDELALARYVSSDRTTEGTARASGNFAHDIFINTDKDYFLIELKKPNKEGFSSKSGANTDAPVRQVIQQAKQIRDRGYIKNSQGRREPISKDNMIRAFVVTDWTDSLKSYMDEVDFKFSKDFGGFAYKYHEGHNMFIEVLDFDRLVSRASARNKAFAQLIE